jgi:deazaflavin-dependent oxidoreductase (nitroreductase family)
LIDKPNTVFGHRTFSSLFAVSAAPEDFNATIIAEFRANAGRVGGRFEGATLLLLHHEGAKSGHQYVNPVVYLPDGERYVIFASKAGAPTNPGWYHNLIAHPEVTIEVGTGTIEATASVAEGSERDRLYERQVGVMPRFAEYQATTERQIPVVVLTPRPS